MSPVGFFGVPRVGGGELYRVGNRAAVDDMGSERDVRPLCPWSAFWVPRVGGGELYRVGDKAALDDMGSKRDARPLCPRPAFLGLTPLVVAGPKGLAETV